ncbi:MAG: DUF2490 domain-containing protein [Gammaproteobacteria bacterium]|jgi:hypothetical protein
MHLNHGRYTLLALLLVFCAYAQASDDWQTWGAIVVTGDIGGDDSNVRYWLEGQGRFNDDSSRFNQGIVRGALGYVVRPRTTLWAGYAFVPSDPQNRSDDVVEHRAWQQLTWSAGQPVAGFALASRTRLEQRTVESTDDTGWRFRQFVKLTRPLGAGGSLYWSLWDELFVNFNDTDWGADGGIDQNRAFAGVGVKLASSAKAEIGYLNQFVRRANRDDAHNHILSLTLLLAY